MMKPMPEASLETQTRLELKRSSAQFAAPAGALIFNRAWSFVALGLHAVLLVLAVIAARLGAEAAGAGPSGETLIWALPPLVLALLAIRGTYRRRSIDIDVTARLLRVFGVTSFVAVTLVAGAAFFDPTADPAPLIVRAWAFSAVYLIAATLLMAFIERHARRTGVVRTPTLVVGAGQVGAQIERRLAEQPELGLRVIGYVDADPVPSDRVPHRRAPILGAPDEFARIAEETGAQHVILTFTSSPDRVLVPLVRACEDRGIQVSLVPRMFESVNLRLTLENIGPLPLVCLAWVDPKGWQFAIKHVIDRVASAGLMLALSPLLLAIAAAVKLSSPGPVLFKQRRIGRDGQRFDMLKFRSMRLAGESTDVNAIAPGFAPGGVEGDEDRRTAVGQVLRRYSLDELPQLLNVLRGEMSLIGPRPERPDFVELFDEQVRRYSDRHRVKSGITGLAQTSGFRGQTSLPERVELDNYYIQNWSMTLDFKIFLRTFGAILDPAE